MGSSLSSPKARPISDDDIKKYTGKTRDELTAWADSQPRRRQESARRQVGSRPRHVRCRGRGGMRWVGTRRGAEWGRSRHEVSAEAGDEQRQRWVNEGFIFFMSSGYS
ncbi:hypothetical protein GQ602_000694 [Ophiocordyceps camponoti-floridani]|uniref:Uncharacterized protein n=1 Tax=Ophiocordyceps camponoti-floridani TaxID=2030778 RepID=A0A8H4VGQ5_9HYPO|nr:hypothetical protein GQ602_000694 [Ophiocordyceps camponoti-floridani]